MQQAQGSNQQPLEEHSVFQIDLISEIVDDTCSDLFASDFPSLSGFDDVYLVIFVIMFIAGPGKYAIDRLFFIRSRKY